MCVFLSICLLAMCAIVVTLERECDRLRREKSALYEEFLDLKYPNTKRKQ